MAVFYVMEGESRLDERVVSAMNDLHLDWAPPPGSVGGGPCGFRGPPFPQKLFAVVDDSSRAVIRWTDDGRAIAVDADHYERQVEKKET